MDVLEEAIKSDPTLKSRMEAIEQETNEFTRNFGKRNGARVVVTIPVVFHVLYRTAAENVSDAQLQSQLDVLNDDFRFTNADKTAIPQDLPGYPKSNWSSHLRNRAKIHNKDFLGNDNEC